MQSSLTEVLVDKVNTTQTETKWCAVRYIAKEMLPFNTGEKPVV